ncbi:voltage-gated potassium channel [Streptomyces sp. LBL]|uniref:potassium channel family protein n=1 Tax=Streptomyces sp. LBL TaxID=2940562 RepID=UPI0024733A38|nr:potassium channel family protein [Streptomyces sp. LBL]MDH6630133.1 voltage-gated potassium channel [Streptomyces sp. LBL]
MLPGFLARAIEALLGREGRSLHLRAAGGALLVLVVVMLTGSWAVVAAEQGAEGATLTTYPRGLWWSVETATTVGYGDFYPVTLGGRIVGVVVMVVGITTYGMVTAALATWFVGRERKRRGRIAHQAGADLRALHERFDRLEQLLSAHSKDS